MIKETNRKKFDILWRKLLHNVYKLEQISYNVHDISGRRLNAVLIGHKSQKYGKYHYKRNVYNWQCLVYKPYWCCMVEKNLFCTLNTVQWCCIMHWNMGVKRAIMVHIDEKAWKKTKCRTHRRVMDRKTAEMTFLMINTSKIHEFITYFVKLLLSTLADLLMTPTS